MALTVRNVDDIKQLILNKKKKQQQLNSKIWKIARKIVKKEQY